MLRNYKAALLDLESDKWLNAMNVEMQSMKDNEVWVLVELPLNGKTVGSKWLFKKKTDMDGAIHTYKDRLVAKGYTQTPWINYEETFSPVADIRAIRILIAISALGEAAYILGIKIYRDRSRWLISLCQSAYIKKILKRYHKENSKCGSIPMQEKLRLSKSQGASTPAELKRVQNVPYALNPGDLHWTTVKNILKYLGNTKDMFLVYGECQAKHFCYSSTKAEYIAAYDASKKAVWVRKFISGRGITKGARHFHAKVHCLRKVIEFGDIKLEKIHTDDNLADPFTKALAFPKHSEHTRNIGMLPASSFMQVCDD
ncbi:retrotransposon protein, putative, ty1-copia subclass [Tanacetum coccineum]